MISWKLSVTKPVCQGGTQAEGFRCMPAQGKDCPGGMTFSEDWGCECASGQTWQDGKGCAAN
jgi:hypothetical protein